ncbi:MAG: MCE family protein [Streptosporangiales bacterium]|nr:MCE family protein [Streptosporangiales bacterium]
MIPRRALARLAAPLLAAVLAGCAFEGAYDLPLPGGAATGDGAYRVTAEFEDVLNLVPRSAVKVDDVTVGEVEDVWRDGWHAAVRLRLARDVRLPDNAVARINQTSLLGEKYVALEPPLGERPAGRLADGDLIPLARTGRNTEVEEVLGALSLLLNGGGVAQLRTITHELNEVMNGREERLRSLLRELDTLVGSLDEQRAQIVRAIEGINRLAATLREERETIGTAVDEVGPALKVLADQRRQLVRMLEAVSELGKVGARVIERSREDLLASLRALEPTLTKLAEAGDALPRSLELLATFPFPDEAMDAVKGDYSNVDITLDLSLATLYHNLVARDAGGSGGSGGRDEAGSDDGDPWAPGDLPLPLGTQPGDAEPDGEELGGEEPGGGGDLIDLLTGGLR